MNCPACGGVVGRDCFNPQECMEITQAQAAAYRDHDPREGEVAIRQIQALRNFLCEEGKNRPMSEDHPVGSVIRYIEELEATVQEQSETLHSLHPVVDPPACQPCNGTGEVDTGGSTPWGAWITDSCPYCEGTGKEKPDACEYCGGKGSIKVDFEHPQWITCDACKPRP